MAMRRSSRPAPIELSVLLAWAALLGPAWGQGQPGTAPAPGPSAFPPPDPATSAQVLDFLFDGRPGSAGPYPGSSEDGDATPQGPFAGLLPQALPELPGLALPAWTPAAASAPATQGVAEPIPAGRAPRKLNGKAEGIWGEVTSQVTVQDAATASSLQDPLGRNFWQTEESWRLEIPGPFFVFGQLGANADEAAIQNSQVTGKTGLACKVPVGAGAEFQVRSGPRVVYTDPLRSDRTRGQSDWLLEVQARCPLLFGVGLEYQGTATPALGPTQRDQVNQDVRLAIPLGSAGKVQLGAKHRWESTTTPQSWSDGMQLYLGLQLDR